jgi:DNA-binding NtrC family response regulator
VVHDVTRRIERSADGRQAVSLPEFAVEVCGGPDAGALARSEDGRLTIGSGEGATLVVGDPTVSRFHVELEATEEGITIRDLGSTNGTRLGAARIREAIIDGSTEIVVGRTRVRLEVGPGRSLSSLSDATAFGGLIGASAPMRTLYTTLERAAPTTAPVLVTGESGTGKELAARAIHDGSPRAAGPFEIIDCGGLPPTLIESELFGHERGAFTGAAREREGAFERADGGTLFLDELGELPLELQPKLLRALGEHEVRRIGARAASKVDVRIVAATNRDLRREVNAGRFRADLYYRLAVIEVKMPALRERLDDIPLLARALLDRIAAERGVRVADVELPAELWQHAWPGNVRELRNYLEQLAILRTPPALGAGEAGAAGEDGSILEGLDALPFAAARGVLVERFEQRYLARLLEETGGNVAEASRRSGVSRATLFRRLRRFDLGS